MRTLLVLALMVVPVFSQTRAEKGRKVIDAALNALGGPAFLAMNDRVEAGRGYAFHREDLSGLAKIKIYTRYLVRPEPPKPGFIGQRERQAQDKDESSLILFTEDACWETTYRGAKTLAPALVERWRESLLHNVLYTLRMRIDEPGMVFELMRTEVFENKPVDVVDILDADNRQTTVYFHQSTHLPLRQSWTRRDVPTKEKFEEVTIFDKFRDVGGGVQWPFVVRRERNGENISQLFMESVEINKNLTDDLFTLSSSQKILDKKPK